MTMFLALSDHDGPPGLEYFFGTKVTTNAHLMFYDIFMHRNLARFMPGRLASLASLARLAWLA